MRTRKHVAEGAEEEEEEFTPAEDLISCSRSLDVGDSWDNKCRWIYNL
jgi:hypothetical protein